MIFAFYHLSFTIRLPFIFNRLPVCSNSKPKTENALKIDNCKLLIASEGGL